MSKLSIEKYLILNKYLLSLFGASEFKDLQVKLKDTSSDVDEDGKTYFINAIISSSPKLNIQRNVLLEYDQNIKGYLKKINENRTNPVNLKYFQYLAVLFTEIFLDKLKNEKEKFLKDINDFLSKYKQQQGSLLSEQKGEQQSKLQDKQKGKQQQKKEFNIQLIEDFKDEDLNKIAFWMATGSGKTLIMHINYLQFLKYNLFEPNSIILITPNESLSKQHFEEFSKSGIPAQLYQGSLTSGLIDGKGILIIEITKLKYKKDIKGGLSIPVEAFGNKNLVFVDEGHKGKSEEGQKWAELRNYLAKDGFTFEYSATFGQILDEKNETTLTEYAKSIIFDYSYKYFYLDGYGKDFSIINIKDKKNVDIEKQLGQAEFQKIMFTANLLSFYEQLLVYEDNQNLAKEYNLEKPLWIFVGTTVTGGGKDRKKLGREETDILQVIELINGVIKAISKKDKSKESWFVDNLKKILNGQSGIKDRDDKDIFKDKFSYIRDKNKEKKLNENFEDLYKRVFNGTGMLRINQIKNAEGEFGLKLGENPYFGVINIGNTSAFRDELQKRGFTVGDDVISDSLFDSIKKENSSINILIGSRKFIEGWDTWRVSSMGLINIGKGQGAQIIQLFGRGVRLKGKGMSLKRTEGEDLIKILETLNIYGIKANYLDSFLKAIENEDIETEFDTIEVPVVTTFEKKWEELYILTKEGDKQFYEDKVLKLCIEKNIFFTLDLLPSISAYTSTERKNIDTKKINLKPSSIKLDSKIIDLFDWDRIWEEIYNFKIVKGYWNLVLERKTLKDLLLSDRYTILATPEVLEIKKQEDLKRLEDISILVIKKYLDRFYRRHARLFEMCNLKYEKLKERPSLFSNVYKIQVNKKKENSERLIQELKKLKEGLESFENLKQELKNILCIEGLPLIYFDKHLYQPLLIQKETYESSPPALVESELKFVSGLKEYLEKNSFSDVEIYLLRNQAKTGIGFFNLSEFYPDFIMWVKYRDKQKIVFIDPKGLVYQKELDQEKIKLHKNLKELEKKLGIENITLDSFILSITPYNKLVEGRTSPPGKDDYEKEHVLFLDSDWQKKLFDQILSEKA